MSYPAKKQTPEERREYARLAREEARAQALGRQIGSAGALGDPTMKEAPGKLLPPEAVLPAPKPAPEPTPSTQPTAGVVDTGGYTFEVLDELPHSKRPGRVKNPSRAAVSAYARTHAGKWIPYPPTAVDPYKHPSTTATQAREGKAGFGPGLDAAVRQKQLYISYVGEGQ